MAAEASEDLFDSEYDSETNSDLRVPKFQQGQDQDELEDKQVVVGPAEAPLTDQQDLKEDTRTGSGITARTNTRTNLKTNPDPTLTLGLKKDIKLDVPLQRVLDQDDADQTFNKTKQDQPNSTKPDRIIVMGDTGTDSKEETSPKDTAANANANTESVKVATTNHPGQDPHIDTLSNKTRLEAMKRMASTDLKHQEETNNDDQEDTGALSVRRHGRRLDETTDWLIGNTRMYGPRETASLSIGWTAAQNFCKAQGGSLASIKEICPPDGSTNRMPLFGIQDQGGDQWVPISDSLNQWVNVGSGQNPTCTKHGGAAPEITGHGHQHGWGNFVVCRPRWYKFGNTQVRDIGAAEDGAIWAIGTYDYGRHTVGDSWEEIGGCAKRISVGSSTNVATLNNAGQIYQRNGNSWVLVQSPPARDISITKDGTIWMTELVAGSNSGDVHRKRPADLDFSNFGGGGDRIAASGPDVVALCNTGAGNLLWVNAVSHWYEAGTCDNGDIGMSSDGTIWTTGVPTGQANPGLIRKSTKILSHSTKWATPIPGQTGTNIAAVSANKVYLVDADFNLWKYEIPAKREATGITRVFGPTDTSDVKSYDQAEEFCESQGGSLASAADICPLDGSAQPYFGIQSGDHWAPASDYHNAWVEVGVHPGDAPTCTFHRDTYNGADPDWGLDGNVKLAWESHYIICNMRTAIYGPSHTTNVESYGQAVSFCNAKGGTLASRSDICPLNSTVPYFGSLEADQWTPVADYANAWVQVGVHSVASSCSFHRETYGDPDWGVDGNHKQPWESNFIICTSNRVLYGRNKKVAVNTYDKAQAFCKAKGGALASSADVCPSGALTLPYFGIQVGDQWTPVSDYNNAWIEVGTEANGKPTCQTHNASFGVTPDWGLTGTWAPASNYLVCSSRWHKFNGLKAQNVGAADDGTIWVIGTHDHGNGCYAIYRHTGADAWENIDGCAQRISVGSQEHIIVMSPTGQITKWTGTGWVLVQSPPARDISITKDGTIWMTELVAGSDYGPVWRKRPTDGAFVKFGGSGDRISGSSYDRATLCNSLPSINSNMMLVHDGSHWYGTGTCSSGDVSITDDGIIWTTGVPNGQGDPGLARRSTSTTAHATTWGTPAQGMSGKEIAAVTANKFLLVDSSYGLWQYEIASSDDDFIQPTPRPTPAPTVSPAPSSSPSSTPSSPPSSSPSSLPSGLPSISPSDVPSLEPSASPSYAPSQQPSDRPSQVPSLSSGPSSQPSSYPSTSPSSSPSLAPSGVPSDYPTIAPTYAAFASTVEQRWQSEWGSIKMFGPRKTKVLDGGWNSAEDFCNSHGGTMASLAQICPTGTTIAEPVNGIQSTEGDQWAPIGDSEGQWVNVGSSAQNPVCTKHGGSTGHGHDLGWGNYVYCSPSNWYKFSGIKVKDVEQTIRDVDAAEDDTIWVISNYKVMTDCYSIHRYVGGDTWEEVRGCANAISVGSRNNIIVTTTDGEIHQWTGHGWTLIKSPAARDASITKDGTIFMTELVSGQVFGDVYRKAPTDNDFVLFGGAGSRISASGPDRVALCNTIDDNKLWSHGGSHWYQTGMCGNGDISVAADGTIWTTGVASGQSSPGLPRRSLSMSASATTWDKPVQGKSGTKIAGVHADMFVMVDSAGTLWQYKVPIMPSQAGTTPLFGPSQTANVKTYEQAKEFCQSKGGSLASSTDICPTTDNWRKHSVKARDVSVADDGTIWVIGTYDYGNRCYSIYRHTAGDPWDSWGELSGCAQSISVGSSTNIVILNSGGQIFQRNGNIWVLVPSPPARDVSITKDGTIWMTELVSGQDYGPVYRKRTSDTSFVNFGGEGERIAGLNADKAVLCNTLAGNHLYSHGGAHWYVTGTCDKGDVSVASDGTIWTTGVGAGQTRPGLPRRSTAFTAHHTSWSPPVQGHSSGIIDYGGNIAAVSAREQFLLVDSNLNLWHYEADKPYFGIQPGDQWTPVSDYEDAWIQVGTHPWGVPACSFHRDTHNGVDPDWGIKDNKMPWEGNYILCNMDKFIYGPDDTSKVIDYDDAKHFCDLKGGTLASFNEICPLPLVKRPYFGAAGGVHWTPFGDYRNGWVEVGGNAVADMCSRHRTKYGDPRIGLGPMWGAEDDKLEGEADYVICKMEGVFVYGPNVTVDVKSYAQAKTFCAARQLVLASSSDVCPPDGSNKPYFDIQTGDQWTPVSDYDNAWIQVGLHTEVSSCSFHKDKYGDAAWGTSEDKKDFEANYIVCTSWFHKHREATSTDIAVSKAVFERREKINKLFSIPDHHLHGRISRSIARYKYPDGKQRNLCAYSESGFNFPYTLAYYKMYPEEGSLEVKYTANLEEMYVTNDLQIMRPLTGNGYFSVGDIIWDGKVNTTENGTAVLVHQKKALLVKGSRSALKKPLYYQNIFNASIGSAQETEGGGLNSGGGSDTNTDMLSTNGTENTGAVAINKPTLWHEYSGVTVRDVGAAYDGTIWVISNYTVMNGCYTIHRKLEGDTWEEVRGCASGISVGSSDNIIITTEEGEIFKWSGQGWDLIPSPAARDATITKDGTIFLTELKDGTDYGNLWRKRPFEGSFVLYGGSGDRIAASGPDKVALCNSLPSVNEDLLWSHGGSQWYVTGVCNNGAVSIAADGTIWTTGVGQGQQGRESAGLARRSTISTAIATTWADPIIGHSGVKIAAMSAIEFALVDSDNKLWRYENPGLRVPRTGNTQVFGPRETGAINSYDQAQQFCEMKGGTLASSSDICPSGSSSWPYFGIQDGDQWTPVSDYRNGWIQVGSHPVVSTCSLHRETYGDPDWGLDEFEKKAWEANYVLCSMKIFVYGPTETSHVNSYDQARNFCVAKGGSLPASSDICPSDGSELWRKEWGDIHMFGPSETSSLAIGWTAAQDFCNSNGGTLASIKDICPPDGGTNSTPVTGIQSTAEDQWAPISERENQWVNVGVGQSAACTFHGGAAPEITGQGRHHGWGNYVFCSPHAKGWYKYRGVSVRDVGAAQDGTVWAIGTYDYGNSCYSIYRHTVGDAWEEIGGCAKRISVGSSINVAVLNNAGQIYQRNGNSWVLVESPPARDISITRDGTIWLTELVSGSNTGDVYRKLPSDFAFRRFGGGGDRIAASGPDVVALCNTGAGNLLWVNVGSHWYEAGSCINGDVGIASDGTIWTTGVGTGQTSPGQPRRSITSTSTATTWDAPVQGRLGGNIAAVSADKFLMVDSSNRLWHYERPQPIEPKIETLSGGSHFVPFDDYHNGWIEIGSDDQSPVCTKKGDVTSEPNYIVCDLYRVVFGKGQTAEVKTYDQAKDFCRAKGGYLASSAEICPSAAAPPVHWQKYDRIRVTDVGAADDGTIWALGTYDYGNSCYSIYRITGMDSWEEIGGCATRISVGSSTNVAVLNPYGQIYQRNVTLWVVVQNPPARDISITKDGTIWMTELVAGHDHGPVWRKRPTDSAFVKVGGSGDRISGTNGDKAVLCNKHAIWGHGVDGWAATSGCNGGDISLAADGTVWTTGVDQNQTGPGLAKRSITFTANITWAQPVQGQSGTSIAAVNSREFLLIDSTNNLWHYFEADEPYFGVQSGDQWTPVSDDINAWVQVGVHPSGLASTCRLHRDTHNGVDPDWGIKDNKMPWESNYEGLLLPVLIYVPWDQAKIHTLVNSMVINGRLSWITTMRGSRWGSIHRVFRLVPYTEMLTMEWIPVGVLTAMKNPESNYIICKSGVDPQTTLVAAADNKFHMFPEPLPDSSKGCVAFKTKAKMNQSFGLSSRADLVQDPTMDWLWVELGTRWGAHSWFIANGEVLNVIDHKDTNSTNSTNYTPSFLDGTPNDFWVCSLAESGGLSFEMGTGRDPSNHSSRFIMVSLPDTTPGERPFFGFKSYNTEELYSDIEVIDLNAAPAPTPEIAARYLISSNTSAPTSPPAGPTFPLNTTNATDSASSAPSSAPTVTPPSLWRPIPPPGYTCLGHVWTIDDTEPPTDLVRCIQTVYVEAVKDPKYQWDSQSNFDFDELTLWEATQTKTTISPGTFISRGCEACDAPLEEFYALRKECIVGHGSVPFCANPGTPWKVEVANQTKIDIPYAKLQPCGFQQEDKRIYGGQDNPNNEWENYAVELHNKSGYVGWKHLGAS
ncbi:Similarities with uniprot P08640 Saccharomyces cerevisiae YIR019c STA1 [Seminavis robusta]|uniref:Similarities with uniprot P08640 Saccharomyces cerevisiae YIR019c STA1 n=1 Tax=Seminavis robusta TaxID=568900 RepID=A0A9N8EFA8_9STRA|nr:Similarities with uniprot P08640 Saccharomyces cerevisiae YIR019c STA1 [Seminavis robusta]|eukprot:Sro916_g219780.1 Similarities with uniprot P08640 Saccharomyces cerevisiae YIR019c STA1 (4086) ;mRNA; f:1964-15716